jgi:uncharacterized protein (DUF488 family)
MYYRRKILLGLLQEFDNQLEKVKLQKLLFLVARNQEKPSFNFVPYKYGCFSFQANADLNTMIKYKQVDNTNIIWKKIDETDYISQLNFKDISAIKQVKEQFGNLNSNDLIKHTYINFPFFAINSTIAHEVLDASTYKNVMLKKPVKSNTTLYTIGYEGKSLEQYLNILLVNDIKVLCDVRRNSISMKYGFSKSQLKNACEGVGIKYLHIPEVGIESDKRQVLNSQTDYDRLFAEYRKITLNNTIEEQKYILKLIKENKRIALTCFEANINQCHRKHLSETIAKLQGFNYELKHI